ncbi:MAG: PAS domain S-box protein [Candidatus Omnitrophota bacterium]
MLTGAAEVCPIPIITKSGVPVPVETRVSHGFWDGSAAIFGVSKDLSKIKLSEEKFSKAFHMNPVSMALLRCEDGIIIDVNKTFLRVFDYSREEVIGQTLSHLNFFVDLADQKVASKTIKCNEIIRETEVTVKAKNGSQRVGLFSTETVYIGKDLCLLTVFVDMSQQKESENALREKTALLGNLLASIPDIIFFKNIHGVYLGCNPEFARFVGREPSMIAGFTDFDLFGREVADSFREQDQIMMGQGVPRHNEEWVAFPDGPRKLLDTFKAPLRDADGRIIGLLGISRDITERDCSQKALAEKEEKIRLLLDSTAEAIYGLDLDGNCTFCNNSCLGLLGYKDPKELLGKNMHLQIHAKHADGTAFPVEKCRIFQAFRKGDATHVDNEVLWRADGTCFYAEYWSYPQREAGAVVGAVVTFLDITERRQAEAEAQKAFRVKSDFISMVSHELRTPLSVIVEGIKLVVDGSCGSLNNEQKEYLTIAERNVDRLGRLINDVLDIQKLESGLMKYRLGEYDINELIAALMVSMGTLAKKRGLELEYAAGTDIPKITFDSDKIAQVMTNLISNALKFTEQGKVTVKTECRDGRVKVSVSDTGTGIREQDMHRLFGKFEQIITGNERKTGGTGLGLSISREIIKSHGGEIWAESEFGVGTTFSFTLPISPRSPASA